MEYYVLLKNSFKKAEVMLQLSQLGPSANVDFASGTFGQFSSSGFGASCPVPVAAPLECFALKLYYANQNYALYSISGKGGQFVDYYVIDGVTTVYDRQQGPINRAVEDLTVSAAQLKAICPPAGLANIVKHISFLNDTMRKYKINTPLRQVHFLSQLAHESAHFSKTLEDGSGEKYEGRVKNLRNTQPGDGPRFKGRGLIQLTGRDAYTAYGKYLKLNITEGDKMKLVEQEPYASDCAGWFWLRYKAYAHLNAAADRDDLISVTKGVNGGLNGLDERRIYYNNAKRVFGFRTT